MCRQRITFKAIPTPPVCDLRVIADGRLAPAPRKAPLQCRLAEGQMSPQHLLPARYAARPCHASHQTRADLLPQATAAGEAEEAGEEEEGFFFFIK